MKTYKRDRRGRFDRDFTLYRWFLIATTIGTISMIGWNTIIKSVGTAFQVENTRAEEVITNNETRIANLINIIYQKAKEYRVNGYQMERTVECESRFNNIQSTAYKNGIREDSWGIAQIHLPDHPDVSKEDALNERFAIEWMAKHFNDTVWYGYNRKLDKCN